MVFVDYELKKRVMDVNIKDVIKYCYQCAHCTDVCPVAKVSGGTYDPRALILDSFLGLKDTIFRGKEDNFNIWGCTMCDTCDEKCPQKIELTEVFTVLKNMSIRLGEGPDHYTGQASAVYDFGKAIPPQPAIDRRRTQLGLPAIIPPNVDEVQKILTETKLKDVLHK